MRTVLICARRPGTLATVTLVIAMVCVAFPGAVARAASGSIAGTVTGNSGAPLKDICVDALNPGGDLIDFDFTAKNGSYAIEGLNNGSYRVEFSDCGDNDVAGEFYNNRQNFNSATPVAVAGGSATAGINAVLGSGGSISGEVTDSSADPLEDICVDVYDSNGEFVNESYTEADGSYSVGGLSGGNHKVEFLDCGENDVAGEYYDNRHNPNSADPVAVAAGSETAGINASLAPGGSISGKVTDGSAGPLEDICVDAYDPSGDESGYGYTEPDGSYTVDGLASGSHRLRFSDCGESGFATEFYDDEPKLASADPITVTAGFETTGIDAALAPQSNRDGDGKGRGRGEGRIRIGKVRVGGPRRLELGKPGAYRVKLGAAGSAQARGVILKVSGRGVRFRKKVGKVSPGKARKIRIRLKPMRAGRIRLNFKVTSRNAGSRTVAKKVVVGK